MKKLFTMLLSVMLVISLIGCGGPSGKTSEENDTAGNKEKIQVKWIQFQIEYANAVQKLADAYMKEHPNVEISLEVNGTNVFETIKAMIASGDTPEIFMTEGYNFMRAYGDYIVDISDEDYVENIVDAAKPCITLDDKIAGLPVTFQGEGLLYNKTIFEENNLDVPTTYSELADVCKKLNEKGITPFTNQFKDDWLIRQYFAIVGCAPNRPDLAQFTEDLYAGKAAFEGNKYMLHSLDFMDFMLENGQKDPLNSGWNEACADFAQGKTAMMFEGEWVWATLESINPDLDIGMIPVPAYDDADLNKLAVDVNGVWHVGKGSKNEEEGKNILRWIATSETAKDILENEFQVIPVMKDWEYKGTNPLSTDAYEAMNSENIYPWAWPTWPDGFGVAGAKEYQEYIMGNYPDKNAVLAELDNIWNTLN